MNLFLTLAFSICICNVTAQVMVSTITDEFPGSGGVNMDEAGNIYIANFGDGLQNSNGNQIWRIDLNGNLTEFATGFSGASGNDFDAEGNLFQANIGNGTVSKVTPNGEVSLFVTNEISCPVGVNVDSENNVYVCNCCGNFGNTIRKVTPDGTPSIFASGNLFKCPNGITRDKNDNLYVSNFDNGHIIKITPDGTPSLFANLTDGGNGNNGHITYNESLDVLFAASHGTSKIYKLTMDGTVTVIAGSGVRGNQDGAAAIATFSRPNGIVATVTGDTLYVNSSIPTTNINFPLNPSVVRMITGVNSTTGIDADALDYQSVTLDVFPNPTRQNQIEVTYRILNTEEVEFKIFDLNGRVVFSKKEGFNSSGLYHSRIDITTLSNGIYQLSLFGKSFLASRKIVVER